MVLVLGALCGSAPELAIAIGVAAAGLLAYRQKLHHLDRHDPQQQTTTDLHRHIT